MKLTPVRAFAPALLVLALAVGGCSTGGDGDASGGSGDSVSADLQAERNAAEAPAAAADGDAATYDVASVADRPEVADERSLIRRGNVSLRADDVGKVQFEVQSVVDTYGGQVTEEKTTTDDDGNPAYTRMVLRIPADDFDEAIDGLKTIEGAELEAANTSESDVTTKVIDVESRLKTQRRSIDRITVLFGQAQSIRDIMAIEAQLSQRQAELDSLERQAAYLAGQTSMSTITVSIDQIPEKKAAAAPKDDDTGFVAGLSAGWSALTTFAVGLATVLGAVLPWLIVIVILGPPLLLLVRALRRRRTAPPAGPAPADA